MKRWYKLAGCTWLAVMLMSVPAYGLREMVPLGSVHDPVSAATAVQTQVRNMAEMIRSQPVSGVDFATLYSDAAIASACTKWEETNAVTLDYASVSALEADADLAVKEVGGALSESLAENGMEPFRDLESTVTFSVRNPGKITLLIEPDICDVKVDYVRLATAFFSLSIKPSDLKEVLTEELIVTLEDVGTGINTELQVEISDEAFAGYLILSFPVNGQDTDCLTIVEQKTLAPVVGTYNEATDQINGRTNLPGVYALAKNRKHFTDIDKQSLEEQYAINALAAIGVTNGTTETTFTPNQKVTRGQFVAMLMRALHKTNNSLPVPFPDVKKNAYYYSAVASAKYYQYLDGYADGLFHPERNLTKAQICKIVSHVLMKEKKYTLSSTWQTALAKYKDAIAVYAQEPAALLTEIGVISALPDNLFRGSKELTRGEIAVILYEMVRRL